MPAFGHADDALDGLGLGHTRHGYAEELRNALLAGRAGSAGTSGLPDQPRDPLRVVGPREALDPFAPAGDARVAVVLRLAQKPRQRGGHVVDALGVERNRHVAGDLAERAIVRAGARDAAVHRLDERKPKALE